MSFFSVALAESGQQAASVEQGGLSSMLLLFGFLFIFYLLIWRPQNKRSKEHKELLNGLTKGDEVATSGGLLGKVSKVQDNFVAVNIAEGVDVMVQKGAITQVLVKGTIKSI